MPVKGRKKRGVNLRRSISHTSRGCFAECPRKYYYEYVLGLDTRYLKVPLIIGTIVHNELDAFYNSFKSRRRYGEEGIEESQARVRQAFADVRMGKSSEGIPNDNDIEKLVWAEAVALSIVKAYVERYEDSDRARIEIIEPETKFKLPVPETEWLTSGRIDLLYRVKKTGKYGIMEHKTASKIDRGYVGKIALDKQTLRYLWAARKLWNLDITEITYNVVGKPAIRQGKKESFGQFIDRVGEEYLDVTKYFYRELIKPTEAMIQSIPDDDKLFTGLIDKAHETGYWPQHTNACYNFNSTCPFLRLCVEGVDEMVLLDYEKKDFETKTHTTEV